MGLTTCISELACFWGHTCASSGEAWKNQPYDLRVQLIEADRLSSLNNFDTFDNQIVGGVEVDADGEPIGSGVPEDELIDEEDETTLELAPGVVLDLGEGEKAHDITPGRSNANFKVFVEAICQQIGAALEIPYELLMKHITASYSASRGALEEAWKMFKIYRTWLANDFCQPIYEEWLAKAVAKGRIKAPGFFADPLRHKAYCKAAWNGLARGLLVPKKEAEAAVLRVENGFSTRSVETMEITGSDFYNNCE